MRVFQNAGLYPSYLQRLNQLAANVTTFQQRLAIFIDDRFGACHLLKPVLERDDTAFFTNGDDQVLQKLWAREQGLSAKATLEEILLAQIEAHKTEVFYNLDPMRYGSTFISRLPACVKKTICWRAAPSAGGDFSKYNLLVNNFPSILAAYEKEGLRVAYFAPAHDPVMDIYAANANRPIDVLFVGGYSRHHRKRAMVLEAVAALRDRFNIVYHLDQSRLTKLSESRVGQMLPLSAHRRPNDIRAVSAEPIFGRELYSEISKAKIILNGAVDMAGGDRGNMRCFESMGCGALMISDQGRYPDGMIDGQTMLTYENSQQAVNAIESILQDLEQVHKLALNGFHMIKKNYNKNYQWQAFLELAEAI